MSDEEVENIFVGDFLDIIACHQIVNGAEEDIPLDDEDIIPDLL